MATLNHLSATTGCSNATLLKQAAQGDQLAWKQLMDRYDGLLRSVARSFRLQDADVQDVAQTTWLRLLQHLHTIRDPEALPGWLAVTASRESLSILRKASRLDLNPMFEEPRNSESAFEPESAVVADDTARDLWASVGELSPRQQRLLIALFREELDSYNEVATSCAMPIGSIGPTRARALSNLRGRLAERNLGRADL
jgi:RNA polymerase sigma factor (sigma-70 family)